MKYSPFGLTIVCLAVSNALAAQEEPTIQVESTPLLQTDQIYVDVDEAMGMAGDGGEYLKSLNGVSGSRLGGHGIDPVIRGQSQTQINVVLDGAYIHGGCPNRMDPPTSYAALETYEKVTVTKGSQTVLYGGGGSGGTVLFERETPRFGEDETLRGKAGAGYGSNGERKEVFADVAAGQPNGFARVIVGAKEADNYEDGDGEEVRSGFKERSGNLILGYTPDNDTRLELGVEAIRGEDIQFFGSMDSPTSDTDNLRLSFSKKDMQGAFSAVKAELYQTDVFHVMDNFSLEGREAADMRMEVPSDSVTRGGRLMGTLPAGGYNWTIGADHQHNNRDAVLRSSMWMPMMSTWGPWMEAAFIWPDVDIKQTGLFAETERELGAAARMRAGLRVDLVEARANKADEEPAAMGIQSPNALYESKYGVIADTHEETNVGGFLRYDRDFAGRDAGWFAVLSRSVRTADATERFVARKGKMPSMDWVGNPDLDPEVHHQLELGANTAKASWSMAGSVFYDTVGDYILKQAGSTGTLYTNVDAVLYGAELESQLNWSRHWSTSLAVAYVRGTNTTDDKPLAQIPAVEGTVSLDYRQTSWSAGGQLRMVNEQTLTDTAGGDVNDETPGYAVFDLYGNAALTKTATVKFGIDNVLNRAYSEHLTRLDAFTGENLAANEPGRSAWIKASLAF